jgi:hypothetical protein
VLATVRLKWTESSELSFPSWIYMSLVISIAYWYVVTTAKSRAKIMLREKSRQEILRSETPLTNSCVQILRSFAAPTADETVDKIPQN